MAFKVLIFVAAVMGAANAGYISSPAYGYAAVATPTLTSQSSNTLRSFGNQGQISHEAKSIQTPFSSVTRSDVRVSNDAHVLAAAPAYATYAAPAVAHATYAAPAYTSYAAPAVAHTAYAAPAYSSYAAPAVAHTYAAPAYSSYAAPAVAHTYAAPAVAHTAYAAPAYTSYAAPAAITKTISTAPAATQLLGVAYSAAPAVAHMSYSNGLGITYAY